MKACVLHAVNDLRYEETKTPVPQEDEVLLKVRAAGICGSDVPRVFEKGTYHFPTIPGHEFSGEIVSVPEGGDSSLIGKRAAVFPLIPCMECAPCSAGLYAQCKNYNYYGSRCDGGFAEYIAVKKKNLVFIPDNVSYEEAAMCEPTAVAIHAVTRARVGYGDVVTIFGAGTIGLLLAKITAAYGASKVILFDVMEEKLEFARKLGFTYCYNNAKCDVKDIVAGLTNQKGSNVTIEGTGVSAALENCIQVTGVSGQIVLMGNPIKEMKLLQDNYWGILRKQLTLRGTWNSDFNGMKNDWQTAVQAMPKLKLKELISHKFHFSECRKAFQTMKSKDEFSVKIIFINESEE
ncbi:galactitol-1-phosphate 5-dehydrogenase [Eubacterium sp. am_0171]|uniref:galactitol-1-phosphate 5-dehydrogenase n=1 Tax=unclassified Eubacterium (in: firmicutes) TaxID=2624479 RepID=UPI001021D484|nr:MULTISPECIES: galactitol-1-phosphate 5-dehydrogenase [unclassified Eubacterium (in: firmicutes)]MSC85585.1 alcohol dehydrogenase catalytic domain-containing protein [Eubacterium sp. BIOML-A1]MSD08040.1 alcohol dehydrogenase catalytic domain-containing protein [Eubacterium sp. BIOML-A2]RYT13371.1 galactitol-1-phosphate 5-dehydrogenase [Eubacterium sp. am_0171]